MPRQKSPALRPLTQQILDEGYVRPGNAHPPLAAHPRILERRCGLMPRERAVLLPIRGVALLEATLQIEIDAGDLDANSVQFLPNSITGSARFSCHGCILSHVLKNNNTNYSRIPTSLQLVFSKIKLLTRDLMPVQPALQLLLPLYHQLK